MGPGNSLSCAPPEDYSSTPYRAAIFGPSKSRLFSLEPRGAWIEGEYSVLSTSIQDSRGRVDSNRNEISSDVIYINAILR